MSITIIRIAIERLISAYGDIGKIAKAEYRDGKAIFICENGERYWYSFASEIAARLA